MRGVVPRADRLGDAAIAYENGVYRGTKKTLDQQRGRLVRADEVTQRTEDRAVAELFSFAQEARGRRRETHALAFEGAECIDLPLQRRVDLIGAKQLGTRR